MTHDFYQLLPFILFMGFLIGALLSLLIHNYYMDMWLSTAGLLIGMLIFVEYQNFSIYWYHYIPVIFLIIIITFIVITKILYQAIIIITPLSSIIIILISLRLLGFPFFIEHIIDFLKYVGYSFYFNQNGSFIIIILILLGFYGISALFMKKQILFDHYKVVYIGKFTVAMHIITEANLFFFSIYFIYVAGIIPGYMSLIIGLYLIYMLLLIYLHFFHSSLNEHSDMPYHKKDKLNSKSVILKFLGLIIIISVFAPWWTISEHGFGITTNGSFLSPLNITFIRTSVSMAATTVNISILLFISACFIICGAIEIILTSGYRGYVNLPGDFLIITGFFFGLKGFVMEQADIFKATGNSIFYGCSFTDGVAISWGVTPWFLGIVVIATLIIIVSIASEVVRKGLFFGITDIVWLVSIPILSIFFLPRGFYFLQSFMVLLWIVGGASWTILWLLYVIGSRMMPVKESE